VRLLAQLSARQTVGSCTIQRDEYDVDEDAGGVQVRRGEKIDELREIVSAALRATDSGKLYNTTRRVRCR